MSFPPVDAEGYSDTILLSLENYTLPITGQWREDADGGAFYGGDAVDEPLQTFGLFVNAWQPLPEPYREEEE